MLLVCAFPPTRKKRETESNLNRSRTASFPTHWQLIHRQRERHRGSKRKNGKAAIDSRIGANKSDTKTQNRPHHLDFFRRILPADRFTAAATEEGGCGGGEPPCHHFSVEIKTILISPPLHHNLSTRGAPPTTIFNTADHRLILSTTTQLLTTVGVADERETIFRINHSNREFDDDDDKHLRSTHFRGTRSTAHHEISLRRRKNRDYFCPIFNSTHLIHSETQTGPTCNTSHCGPWKVFALYMDCELKLDCAKYDRETQNPVLHYRHARKSLYQYPTHSLIFHSF